MRVSAQSLDGDTSVQQSAIAQHSFVELHTGTMIISE